jgi:hypothetical protein
MNCYDISSVADMTKKPAETKNSQKKRKRMTNKTNNDNDNDNDDSKKFPIKNNKSIQIAYIIPVLEERFLFQRKLLLNMQK